MRRYCRSLSSRDAAIALNVRGMEWDLLPETVGIMDAAYERTATATSPCLGLELPSSKSAASACLENYFLLTKQQ